MDLSQYITKTGMQRLQTRINELLAERPEVIKAVAIAREFGDLSENAEYKEGKRELRSIDRRLRFLTKRLEALKIVEYAPQQEGKVYFGAWVELENEQGDIVRYRIVGTDEIDTKNNYITIDSPMARALIGKQVDDEVRVQTPSGEKEWYINKIQYQPFSAE